MLVTTFRKGIIEIDPEENERAGFFSKVIYSECPNCGAMAEMDLLYSSAESAGVAYACGCTLHSEKGKESVWVKENRDG